MAYGETDGDEMSYLGTSLLYCNVKYIGTLISVCHLPIGFACPVSDFAMGVSEVRIRSQN